MRPSLLTQSARQLTKGCLVVIGAVLVGCSPQTDDIMGSDSAIKASEFTGGPYDPSELQVDLLSDSFRGDDEVPYKQQLADACAAAGITPSCPTLKVFTAKVSESTNALSERRLAAQVDLVAASIKADGTIAERLQGKAPQENDEFTYVESTPNDCAYPFEQFVNDYVREDLRKSFAEQVNTIRHGLRVEGHEPRGCRAFAGKKNVAWVTSERRGSGNNGHIFVLHFNAPCVSTDGTHYNSGYRLTGFICAPNGQWVKE